MCSLHPNIHTTRDAQYQMSYLSQEMDRTRICQSWILIPHLRQIGVSRTTCQPHVHCSSSTTHRKAHCYDDDTLQAIRSAKRGAARVTADPNLIVVSVTHGHRRFPYLTSINELRRVFVGMGVLLSKFAGTLPRSPIGRLTCPRCQLLIALTLQRAAKPNRRTCSA